MRSSVCADGTGCWQRDRRVATALSSRNRVKEPADSSSGLRRIASIALLVFLFLGVRWNTFTAPFERDEGEYAYSAWLMRHNAVPYENTFLQKPPMILYVYLAGQTIGDFVWIPRALAVLFLAGATVGLAWFARSELGEGADLTAVWLATPMLALPALQPYAANNEIFLLLPLMATLVIYARHRGRAGAPKWFLAGSCAAFSLLFKPTDLYLLAFVALVWIVETAIDTRNAKSVLSRIGSGLLGAGMTSALVLGWFLMKGAGRSMWEEIITFNLHSQLHGEIAAAFVAQIRTLWVYWRIVLLLPIWLVIRRPPRWWFHLGLAATAVLGIYQSRNGHYYLLLAPFLALAATASIRDLLARFRVTQAAIVGFTALIMFVPALLLVTLTPNELTERIYDSRNPFVESPEVARRVSALTKSSDFIYVAGSEPQILYYARRRSSTRFVISYPLMFDTPLASRYQEQAVEDLRQHPPAVVVFARSNLSWSKQPSTPDVFLPYLKGVLDRDFRLVGGFVREGETASWAEPLRSEQVLQCSLLVFARR
jgi:hypothetical protein